MGTAVVPTSFRSYLGLSGFVLGGAALILVLVHFVAGPFAPSSGASVTLGEFAADIAKSAARDLVGVGQPAPEAQPWTIDRIVRATVIVIASIALLLGLGAFVRRENKRLAACALLLGGGAIVFQIYAWTLMLVLGFLILTAFMNSLGDIFSFG